MRVLLNCAIYFDVNGRTITAEYKINLPIDDQVLASIMLNHTRFYTRRFYQDYFSDRFGTLVIQNKKVVLQGYSICPEEPKVYKMPFADYRGILSDLISGFDITPVNISVKDSRLWIYSRGLNSKTKDGELSFDCIKQFRWLPIKRASSFTISIEELKTSKIVILEEEML